jgi:hypothetical protein
VWASVIMIEGVRRTGVLSTYSKSCVLVSDEAGARRPITIFQLSKFVEFSSVMKATPRATD